MIPFKMPVCYLIPYTIKCLRKKIPAELLPSHILRRHIGSKKQLQTPEF